MKARQVIHPLSEEIIGHAHTAKEARAILLEHVPAAFVATVELRAGSWEALCERAAVALILPRPVAEYARG